MDKTLNTINGVLYFEKCFLEFESQMKVEGKHKIFFLLDNFSEHTWGQILYKLLITRGEILPLNTTFHSNQW